MGTCRLEDQLLCLCACANIKSHLLEAIKNNRKTLEEISECAGMAVSHTAGILLISAVFFYGIAVLFGAHPVNHLWGNVMWAVLMTLLVCVPSLIVLGQRSQEWIRVFIQCRFGRSVERGLFLGCVATFLGAWLGAFPILLDWNRPWQVWPIPCSVGALSVWACYWAGYFTVQHFFPQVLTLKRTPV